MRAATLVVRGFRNLADATFTVPRDGVALIGPNGHGKTNVLEALAYPVLFRSVRGAHDRELARFNGPGFHVELCEVDGTTLAVTYNAVSRRKRVVVRGEETASIAGALGHWLAVVFLPTDLALVQGGAGERRKWIDRMLSLADRVYLQALLRYRAALAQRNAALRESLRANAARAEQRVAVWEAPLAEHGAVLWRERVRWSGQAAGRFAELCAAIGEQAPVAMRYATSLEPASMEVPQIGAALARSLEHKRGIDMRRGITHAGPHRDDLTLTLDGRELRAFGSAGQQRTAAIALRLLEAETLRERLGAAPLFLLDDPFAELDARRSSRILELLADQGMGQTLLTVPRESDIPPALSTLARWRIASGVVTHDDAHAGAA